jgi:hypothetical protein
MSVMCASLTSRLNESGKYSVKSVESVYEAGDVVPVVSITRLRLRNWRFFPRFAILTWNAARQAITAPRFLGGAILADRQLTFWTMTMWTDEAALRGYMLAGAHQRAMPHLVDWCDEASVARWDLEETSLPSWSAADMRMRQTGRPSRVRHPSDAHTDLAFRSPRLGASLPLKPRIST